MTMQVCGYAAHYAKAPLSPFSFDRREPRDHDVAIDIKYSGICHLDIHQVNNGWGGSTFPMVPGHEIASIVSQFGTEVTRLKVGDRVAVGNFVDSCRKCGLAIKALSSIVWKEQHGLIMQLKGMEKLKPKEVIQTRSYLMITTSFGFPTTYVWIVQHPFFAGGSRYILL